MPNHAEGVYEIQSLPLGVKCANIVPLLPRESNISSQGKIPPRRYAQSANFAFGEGRLLPVYVWVCIRTPISKERTDHKGRFFLLAAELGFEPRHTESESAVLPLHNSARLKTIQQNTELSLRAKVC